MSYKKKKKKRRNGKEGQGGLCGILTFEKRLLFWQETSRPEIFRIKSCNRVTESHLCAGCILL